MIIYEVMLIVLEKNLQKMFNHAATVCARI